MRASSMERSVIGLAMLAVVAATAACNPDEDHGDPRHDARPGLPESTALWITSSASKQVYRVDLATGELAATATLPGHPERIAAVDGSAWIPGVEPVRVDATSGEVSELDLDRPREVLAGDGEVWFGFDHDDRATVASYDLETGRLGEAVPVGDGELEHLAWGYDGVIFAVLDDNSVVRVDTRTGETVSLPNDDGITYRLTVAGDTVWAVVSRALWEIDADTLELRETHPQSTQPFWIATDHRTETAWVGFLHDRVARIDPATGTLTDEVAVPGTDDGVAAIQNIALANDDLWVVRDDGVLLSFDTETAEAGAKMILDPDGQVYRLAVDRP